MASRAAVFTLLLVLAAAALPALEAAQAGGGRLFFLQHIGVECRIAGRLETTPYAHVQNFISDCCSV